jgi:hypothetical protein
MQHQGQRRQRDWQADRRQQQRVYNPPRPNWGQIRREQAFEAKRQRDVFKAQRRAERDYWKFDRKQQQFENKVYRQPEFYVHDDRPYYYEPRPEVWFGDDYSDYDRYARYTVFQPTYRTYDYAYSDFPLYSTYIYDEDDYGYDGGYDWKSLLFRSVISAFFSNSDNIGYFDAYPQYSTYYDDGYYGYIPQYRYQPPYYTFGYAPTYAYYEPAAYYGYDQYTSYGVPYDYIAYGSLPYGDMVDIYSGGLAAELIQRALGAGYYQGLLEGQLARERGWGDEYYYDPYLYEQAVYDPYSTSMGSCRRYLSEGYEMGYQDALAGRDEFDLDEGGDIDLVSLLLGSVLDFRG